MKKIFLLLVGICLFYSCNSEQKKPLTKQELITQKIDEKVKRWRVSTERKCTERVLESAASLVDSILLARARLDVDSIPKPLKPTKPLKPIIKVLKDTLPIAPILKDTM